MDRRRFLFGSAVAAVVTPIMVVLPSRRAVSSVKATPGYSYIRPSTVDDIEQWAGGVAWVDAEYDRTLAEIVHRKWPLDETVFAI